MAGRSHGGFMARVALVGMASMWCVPAAASPGEGAGRSAGEEAVLACRGVAGQAEQLACFRRASEALAAEQAPAPRPFGAPRPRPLRAAKAAEVRQVTMRLVAMRDPGDGRVVFDFDDGSTWRESEPDPVSGALRAGQSVTLEHGVLDGYLLDIPGRASVHVTRARGS